MTTQKTQPTNAVDESGASACSLSGGAWRFVVDMTIYAKPETGKAEPEQRKCYKVFPDPPPYVVDRMFIDLPDGCGPMAGRVSGLLTDMVNNLVSVGMWDEYYTKDEPKLSADRRLQSYLSQGWSEGIYRHHDRIQRAETNRNTEAPVEQLNEALNLIGVYCRDQMPDGFELRIKVTNSEMWCELEEPGGTDAEGWEADESNPVVDACDYANHAQYD